MRLRIENISFSYGKDMPVISHFSMEGKMGDRIAIRGESGSGKTTIIRLLLGFERPTKGEIFINDKKRTFVQLKFLRQNSCWLPQDLDLGQGKLKEVFCYPFQFKNNPPCPEEQKIFSIFERLGLPKKIWSENFENLSTGQRQRVGIALCYLLDKPLIFLDEPTSALDEQSKKKVSELLFEDQEKMIISTSHDQWWIDRCSKIIDLDT
ncbi:hypothetical protein C7S20_06855 [Christiangramia fulva]|uniref:ABC transporter domain-containing protein n=1 Tax=Christiangramia fulva TaxID=2126553 RepID=A0A2R3Z471_9FLAO|nr:ABC transporter ATP-binding protein [Christiangramia fulva]AVR45012.1 hypothetical protein C7S20_06855 [Christiangramia fulva]